jgi:type II secretory pathway predicted ATPase ExeA
MHNKHFDLTGYPFGNEIALEEMYASTATRELGTRVGHVIEMSGIGLVTGDGGTECQG